MRSRPAAVDADRGRVNEGNLLKNTVLLNIVLNAVVAMAFVLLNIWALGSGLEETVVALALLYGLVTVTGNALFVAHSGKRG